MIKQQQHNRTRTPCAHLTPAFGDRDRPLPKLYTWLLAIIITGLLPVSVAHAAVTLKADTGTATAGYYQLTWEADMPASFQLQEARSADFSNALTVYNGPDLASAMSGRSNGDYFYRIRTVSDNSSYGPWSNVVKVTVAHHSLNRAFMFFTAGAIVFLAILGSIILGSRKQQD